MMMGTTRKKNVLITGGSGFIGRAMVTHFLNTTDWSLVILDRLSYATSVNRLIKSIEPKNIDRIKLLYHDLRAPIEGHLFDEIGAIDIIVNVASESHVDRSITNPGEFIQNNISLVINMLEYAGIIKPEVFIQISTDEVYGPAPAGVSHKEWDTHMPSNPYAASKSAQEAIAISYWRTFGVPVIITNTMNNFGEDQHPEKYIPMVVRKVVDKEDVTVHGGFDKVNGSFVSGTRVWLHANNHADAVKHIIENVRPDMYPEKNAPRKIHVAGEKEVSNLEIVNLVSQILDIPAKISLVDFHSSRPGHDLRYSLDGSYLRQNLAWTPPHDFDKSFKDTVIAIAKKYNEEKS